MTGGLGGDVDGLSTLPCGLDDSSEEWPLPFDRHDVVLGQVDANT